VLNGSGVLAERANTFFKVPSGLILFMPSIEGRDLVQSSGRCAARRGAGPSHRARHVDAQGPSPLRCSRPGWTAAWHACAPS